MKSCDGKIMRSIIRSDWKRFWPLAVCYAAFSFVALPVVCTIDHYMTSAYMAVRQTIASVTIVFVIAGFILGCLLAMALFSWLMTRRSVDFVHSLPVSRSCLFISHFICGVSMFTAVNLFTLVSTFAVQAAKGAFLPVETLSWFAAVECADLFFFAFGVLCCTITGWLLAMPVIYAGLQVFIAVISVCVQGMKSFFYKGWISGSGLDYPWLTPPVRMCMGITTRIENSAESDFTRYYTAYAPGFLRVFLVYAAAAVAVTALAMLAYKARKSENVSTAIVFPWLRHAARFVIGFCSALVAGVFLQEAFWYSDRSNPVKLLIIMLIAGFAVSVGVEMLLKKTFAVFKKRSTWAGFSALAAALVLTAFVVRADPGGFVSYVPDMSEVASIEIYMPFVWTNDCRLAGDEAKALTAELHRAVIAESEHKWTDNNEECGSLYFTYILNDGTRVSRSYTVIKQQLSSDFAAAINNLANCPELRRASVLNGSATRSEGEVINYESCTINVFSGDNPVFGSSTTVTGEDLDALLAAIYADCSEYGSFDVTAPSFYSNADCTFYSTQTDIYGNPLYARVIFRPDMPRTIECLLSIGAAENAEDLFTCPDSVININQHVYA